MAYALDTSGEVCITLSPPVSWCPDAKNVYLWDRDLSPFVQGYVEAMFASLRPDFYRIKAGVKPYGGKRLKVAYRMFDPDGGPLREVTGYVHVSASKIATAQRLYRAEELEVPGFSDLAPETLARIIADCEAAAPAEPRAYNADALRKMGADLWRRSGKTVQLGDDGKVRFADRAFQKEN